MSRGAGVSRRPSEARWEPILLLLLAIAVTGLTSLGAGVRSTYAGHAAVDEPEYLLTALSIAEDGDLDIADELAGERWRVFHERDLPVQTSVLPDGRRISPHDPLLPLLLALPMRWGGFLAAKLTLAAMAGALAALTCWTAVHRFGVSRAVALPVVGLLSLSAPLSVYATQVYPELPAALAVMAAIAVGMGALRRRGVLVVGAAVTALPWLSVKYAGVAAALAVVVLVRLHRRGDSRAAIALASGLSVMGAAYLVAHRLLYGGWTAYATGDHFERTGELAVVGTSPDLPGRSLRLAALLVDRGFGLVAWQPAWLLLVAALAFAVRRRRAGSAILVAPLLAGYLTATFVALTMHGFWWPGRQLVVVLPVATVLLCQWAEGTTHRAAVLLTAASVGVVTFGWLLVEGHQERLTWVTGFEGLRAPTYRLLRVVLPDYRLLEARDWVLHIAWCAALLALGYTGWRAVRPTASAHRSPTSTTGVFP
ncbi:MAG TPA: hypothetical protein VNB94_13325 [Mycobacteriales bacterium]|nr:hypothetical protein [Mycobacteriales bacterium]